MSLLLAFSFIAQARCVPSERLWPYRPFLGTHSCSHGSVLSLLRAAVVMKMMPAALCVPSHSQLRTDTSQVCALHTLMLLAFDELLKSSIPMYGSWKLTISLDILIGMDPGLLRAFLLYRGALRGRRSCKQCCLQWGKPRRASDRQQGHACTAP